jgi:SNF2 family DNA or RNA helicase
VIYNPWPYQDFAFHHILNVPYCGVFMDMGLGKTVTTLTALHHLIYRDVEIERALVVAPKHVTRTVWKQEAEKWDHLKKMKVSIVWGSPTERIAALKVKADVYVINRENLVWLVNLFKSRWPFSTVVLDELSSYKNHSTQRFKAIKLVRYRIKRLIGLTGTPAPNSLLDIWAPMYLLDQGQRLEKGIEAFRARYFYGHKVDGYIKSYKILPNAEQVIYDKIGDICISMKSRDYLDLPPLIENDIYLEMDVHARSVYDRMEEDSVIELMDKEVTAVNAAALSNKLLQMANGAAYYEEDGVVHKQKPYVHIHDAKLDALEEILEEAMGKSVLVFYTFRHDLERIRKRFLHARQLKTPQDIEDWNNGKIELLVAHPASAGHGLNLQAGGNIMVWFGQTWSLELYMQAIARLLRQGQTKSVILHRLIMIGTMDEDVILALAKKMSGQDALMEAVKARIDKYAYRSVVG